MSGPVPPIPHSGPITPGPHSSLWISARGGGEVRGHRAFRQKRRETGTRSGLTASRSIATFVEHIVFRGVDPTLALLGHHDRELSDRFCTGYLLRLAVSAAVVEVTRSDQTVPTTLEPRPLLFVVGRPPRGHDCQEAPRVITVVDQRELTLRRTVEQIDKDARRGVLFVGDGAGSPASFARASATILR